MNKTKQKPQKRPTGIEPEAPTTNTDGDQQFQIELYWCIQQLQAALSKTTLTPKQTQDHVKALNTLMSKTAPLVKKRQVMRMSFGDYRSKMAVEEKKLSRVNAHVKLSQAKPSPKSLFLRKSSGEGFRFNFEVPPAESQSFDCDDIKSINNLTSKLEFVSCNNSFKFDFEVPD